MFRENSRFHLYERMHQSTVSPLGENKRGEFLHVIPPPNPRQPNCAKASLDRRGKSSGFASIIAFKKMRLEYYLYA